MIKTFNSKTLFPYLSVLLILIAMQHVHAGDSKKALSKGEQQMLDQWPYLYYEAQEKRQTPAEKDQALTKSLEFHHALRNAAWKLKEEKPLVRSPSSNKLFDLFQNKDGDRIYGVLGLNSLYTKKYTLNLEELVILRDKVRNVTCRPRGDGEGLKADYLLQIQSAINKLEVSK